MTIKILKKECKIIAVSLLTGLLISLVLCVLTKAYSERVMDDITSEVFRFHILANSDSEEDQALKLALRDEILKNYEGFLTSSHSKAETMSFFRSHLSEIKSISEEFLKAKGCNYSVKAEVAKSAFPIRKYGDFTLPAGTYDCLKISIGKAAGHNWWCVMFPPLCYVEGTYDEAGENACRDSLSPDVYSIISGDSEAAPANVKLKLKIVEFWQNR
ncbi:MAG: stage II sporulation protein R [Clostridiales bacterium]|nr:stage II sporulation protein R [Clostridiales bacterium]